MTDSELEHTATDVGNFSIVDRPFLIVLESAVAGEPGRIIGIAGTMTIGRSEGEVIVKDAALSKRHAELSYEEGVCRIRDLESRNGTRVNGTRVSTCELRSGDQIRIGATVLQYQHGSSAQTQRTILGTLGDSGVALWEYFPGTAEFGFSEHVDAALELPRSARGRARVALDQCIHTDDRARLALALEGALQGRPFELEVRMTLASLDRWVALRGRLAPSSAMVAGTIVNITASKRREATLTRTALVFESFSDGVVLTDLESAIVDLNSAMSRAFGVNRRDAIGRSVFAIVPVDDPAHQLATIRAAVEQSGRWSGTLCLPTEPDQIFEVQVFPLLTDRGESAGTVWVFRDVTERSKLEGRLAFLDRLASLGTMSAGVAHEINNPLTFVLANAEHIRESLAGTQQSSLIEAVDEVIEGAVRIGQIVQDLKTFGRADTAAAPRPTHLRAATELAIKMAKSIVGFHVRVDVELLTDDTALAVESHLVQIIVNLLVNAVQAQPEEGGAPLVTVRVDGDADGVALEVVDTGIGMTPEVASRAFDPFFTTKPMRGGTGLGLSICHGLVTQMRGTITLRTAPGAGTTVRVWLPRATEPAKVEMPRVSSVGASPKLRILIVDDEPLLLRSLSRILRDQDVVTANSFQAASRILIEQRERFDVILCDLMMPDGTGMELHARMLDARPELVPRMVFFTGAAFTEESQRFLDTTTNLQLFKPVDSQTLRRMLFQAAGHGRSTPVYAAIP